MPSRRCAASSKAGDVPVTCADPRRLDAAIGRWPWTSLDDGLARFVASLERWDPRPARPATPRWEAEPALAGIDENDGATHADRLA
jgi:hypothetical protein